MDIKKKLSRLRTSTTTVDKPSVAPSFTSSVDAESFESRAAKHAADAAGVELTLPEVGPVRDTSADGPGPSGDERADAIRSRLMQMAERKAKPTQKSAKAVKLPLPGEVRSTAVGDVHVVAQTFAADHVQGTAPLTRAWLATGELVAKLALDARLEGVDFRRALFIDTETTGLSHGAGTLPFLIGFAYFEGEALQLEQLVLRKPGEERPMLMLLAERIAAASCIVSYNGKSFDWPLLRTRYVLNRLAVPEPAAHVDLLHCARRVYKRRLTCVQLTELEQQVLGMERVDDVGGAAIPVVYTDFLRSGDATQMNGVLTHNAHDLVSLVALLGVLVDKLASASGEDDLRDQLALAELSVRAGDGARAHAFASTASAGASHVSAPALALLAGVHKKRGEYASAAASLERALAVADAALAPKLHLELAKIYERYLRDPQRALPHARAALAAEPELANARRISRLTASTARLALPFELEP